MPAFYKKKSAGHKSGYRDDFYFFSVLGNFVAQQIKTSSYTTRRPAAFFFLLVFFYILLIKHFISSIK